MKAKFSLYLTELAPGLKMLIDELSKEYDYVSVLASDSKGFSIQASQKSKAITSENMTTERGCVVRVYKDGLYSEYSFNKPDKDMSAFASKLKNILNDQFEIIKKTSTEVFDTDKLDDEPCELFTEMETDIMPQDVDLGALMEKLQSYSDRAVKLKDFMIDAPASAKSTHVCKMFLTKNRDMRQSYVYTEGSILAIGAKNGRNTMSIEGVSGRSGAGILDDLEEKIEVAVNSVGDMLDADPVVPGEYEIITSPEVTGLIAHEAFGHGVEMDMFVKGRALGAEYIDKRVGSDLVSMHEGANCVVDVASYAFDDEGTLAGDVTEIDHGILKTGVCDALAALRLGTKPTGNGKRENFEHKVYTRMTNTMFDSGSDSKEDMIASVKKGYYLEGMFSGMEDPKHWGIQCIVARGREIIDGKFTGKVVAPVVMTGYVPDLLGSISMVSTDRESFGNGGCGKGHKEWVKVSDGGPYLKAIARLG
ncbi:TldD/PmbA family protein [Butyrivibrio sp. INlla16]|uniref:TldD/PmbA family protein n=1 Tax=Butyrivibrio sp. INlla16 TaxID=1520807 RepID=UPI0008926971|nr:TldD/PmbA family protein [Butyrivibrio sp. INlla16]SDB24698.1 TldD protein [Butyrivibrio sp. INlla16]